MKWSPYYQRQIQKAAAFDPNQNEFVSSMMTNPIFEKMAGEQAMQIIQQMQLAASQEARNRSLESAKEDLSLSQDRFETSKDLRDKTARFNEKDSGRAERLALIGLGGNTVLGALDLRNKLNQAKRINQTTKRLYEVV